MKLHGLIPSPDSVDDETIVDESTARLALDPEPAHAFTAHGVQLTLPSVSLWVTQLRTERGWTFQIKATTPHAEAEVARIYTVATHDDDGSAGIGVWAELTPEAASHLPD